MTNYNLQSKNALFIWKKGGQMKKRISDEDEVKLYHIVCDISKICKNYFYERKYLPSDCWCVDDVVNEIALSSKRLKNKYKEIREQTTDTKEEI